MPAMQPAQLSDVTIDQMPSGHLYANTSARCCRRGKLRWNGIALGLPGQAGTDVALHSRDVILASFEVVLHRFLGQDEITILAMTDDGLHPYPIGWVSAMLIRADLGDDPPFHALAEQVVVSLRQDMIRYDDVRHAIANNGHSADGVSAIQAVVIFQHSTCPTPQSTRKDEGYYLSDNAGSNIADLVLIVREADDGMQFGFDYAPNVFTPAMIEEMSDSFQTLLTSIAEDMHRPVSRLNLLSPSQREKLLIRWNDTGVPFPQDKHTEQLFDEQAARSPERIALRYQNQSVTYDELRRRSNQLARYLQEQGIGPGKLVAICTDRSPDMVVGLLGILKSGAAYVPLDPSYPADRLGFMLADAQAAALVTQANWVSHLPETTAPVIRLDADRSMLDARNDADIAATAGPDDLAYVIYTSGSTGKPKGVAVRRCGFVNFINAMKRSLDIAETDVFLAITTISFDIAGLELFLPLATGSCVVLATRDDATQPDRLARLIDDERVTVFQATPASWRMILDSSWTGRGDLKILCGGEAMTRDLADRLLRCGAVVWNMYGPTETTVWSTMCKVDADGPILVGCPIDNTEIYILDKHLQPVPIGAVGELHIGGIGLAREYLHRPELTAEKFIPHPFSGEPGARIYKTGDLARYWPDGRIECLGRNDHQVKIRGFRIELPEIEARLSAHPAVKQVAVTARDDGNGDKYLAAYWVDREASGSPIAADDLRKFLASTLPGHMVPSAFVNMRELPLTPNGKIDRRALPDPDKQARHSSDSYVAPCNATQRQLVEIWENLLNISPIGIRDDFFLLGGHSLAAVRMMARIETATGVSIPVSSLLSCPTIEGLAQLITDKVSSKSSVTIGFRRSGSRPPLFMVAGVGGHVLIFRELAKLLGDDHPVYGLQGIGLDGVESPLNNMRDIAARYIEEMLAIQPQGPWVIAGWSMGGVIAYEIARQMLAQGRQPDAIIIVDTYAPWAVPWRERLGIHLSAFWRRSWINKLEYLADRVIHRVEVLRRRFGYDNVSADLDGPTADRVRRSSLAQFEALRRYRPEPLSADVFLLRADQTAEIRDPRARDAHLGWGTLIHGKINVLPISGNHTGIFTGDHVRVLADAMRQCLDAADAKPIT